MKSLVFSCPRILLITSVFCALVMFLPAIVSAHPGNTDSYGCHTCRTNCSNWGLSSGEYHCHNAKTLPQPKAPVTSTYSESGGTTRYAPEYEQTATTKTTTQSPAQEITTPKSKEVDSDSNNWFWWLVAGVGGGYLFKQNKNTKKP